MLVAGIITTHPCPGIRKAIVFPKVVQQTGCTEGRISVAAKKPEGTFRIRPCGRSKSRAGIIEEGRITLDAIDTIQISGIASPDPVPLRSCLGRPQIKKTQECNDFFHLDMFWDKHWKSGMNIMSGRLNHPRVSP